MLAFQYYEHMKKIGLSIALLLGLLNTSSAQTALELKQQSLSKWNIGAAQYSGITSLGGNRYALVSDKEPTDGFFIFRIDQSSTTGDVTQVYLEGFKGNKHPKVDAQGISIRDCEGIAYVPSRGTLFISGEGDQRIMEYDMYGQPTGHELHVPNIFSSQHIVANYGFEALCYDTIAHRFWTTTESTLPADGPAASPQHPGGKNLLRIQAFDDALQPVAQYAYRMDAGQTDDFGKIYVMGVPELTPLPDGKLLVLEREANVTSGGLSSAVRCKLFVTDPAHCEQIDANTSLKNLDNNHFLSKRLLADWTTHVQPFNITFANYEGMCLGRPLPDGRQTLLLVNDSQGGYRKGPFRLKDYIKVIVIGN